MLAKSLIVMLVFVATVFQCESIPQSIKDARVGFKHYDSCSLPSGRARTLDLLHCIECCAKYGETMDLGTTLHLAYHVFALAHTCICTNKLVAFEGESSYTQESAPPTPTPVSYSPAQTTTIEKSESNSTEGDVNHPSHSLDNFESLTRENNDTCTICLEPLNNESITFQCGHTFHVGCIAFWAQQNRKCPICRETLHLQSGEHFLND